MRLLYGLLLFFTGHVFSWFQSNSTIVGEDMGHKALLFACLTAPLTTISFAVGTKFMYASLESLWSVRFISFGIGYLVFIPLTWYFLGEEMITTKNIVSFLLCVALLMVQAFMN
tara:strand:+ start:2776 stop:3117 length:342 start_codon:yes stop_codon:yes gene_type:complete